MKKGLFLTILVLTLILSTAAVSAQYNTRGVYHPLTYGMSGHYAPVHPSMPRIDSRVRAGGNFIGASPFMVGLRAPIYTHTPLNFQTRYDISRAYYPTARTYGSYGDRFSRIGGRTGSFNTVSTAGGFAWRAGSLGPSPQGGFY